MPESRSIEDWILMGYRKQFLSPKAYVKQLVNNTDIDQYVDDAEQFARKCSRAMFKFKPSMGEIRSVATNMDYIIAHNWLAAVRELQFGSDGSEKQWRQVSRLGGQYVRLELATNRYRIFLAGKEEKSEIQATSTFYQHAAILKNFLRLDEIDEAVETALAIDEMVSMNAYYDFIDVDTPSCTGALIATLVLEKIGHKPSQKLSQRFEHDELVVWFYENWNTADTDELSRNLAILCDRHTQMSRYYSNKETYEFPRIEYFYDVSEVLSILRLRELAGKEVPQVAHKLLGTPLGSLMCKGEVEKIDIYISI